MLPVPLDGLPQVSDPLALLIAAGSGAISLLVGIVLALVQARMRALEVAVKELTGTVNELYRKLTALESDGRTARSDIESLKGGTLPRELFNTRMDAQDEKLDRLEANVEEIDRGMSARPTRSEMSMPVARQEPPPMPPRPKLPSRGRYGA
jgi:hypothetical protein